MQRKKDRYFPYVVPLPKFLKLLVGVMQKLGATIQSQAPLLEAATQLLLP